MTATLQPAFRLFRRKRTFYSEDTRTGAQKSLRTRDKVEANRLLSSMNEAVRNPAAVNLQLARTYISASDPTMLTRTWQSAFDSIIASKKGPTQERWERAAKDEAFEVIRCVVIIETKPEQLLQTISNGTISTNVYLRRLHNFAIDMGWLLVPVLPKKKWPKIKHGETRAITRQEHELVVAGEKNPQRRAFYELLWLLGGSQSDIGSLHAQNVNYENGTVFYNRRKTSVDVMQGMGKKVKAVLATLPTTGPLFPDIIDMRASDRATEFKRACKRVGVKGVTPHSYRYAWAERAAAAGYPERYAQAALGHNSKAVARAYARKAKVVVPPLEDYEEKHLQRNEQPSSKEGERPKPPQNGTKQSCNDPETQTCQKA